MDQKHLKYKEVTNLGCFYTPPCYVNKLLGMLSNEIENINDFIIIDTSCGYGSFFEYHFDNHPRRLIGGDIDKEALRIAQSHHHQVEFFHVNALRNIARSNYNLSSLERLIIVGNPPYNDVTSKVKMSIKQGFLYDIDPAVKTRDLGISFILSYAKLNPDYVCILHPLSYLIKKANYELLRPFLCKYKLIDSLIMNSKDFTETSKGTGFPIIMALYKKDDSGSYYQKIMQYKFTTIDGKVFDLNFDTIKNYLKKYPNKYIHYDGNSPLFWTMRDINALKRSRTFVTDYSENTIIVDKKSMPYYCYVDVFKDYIKHVPYYFGNCDVMIDNAEFIKIKDAFIAKSIQKNPFIAGFFEDESYSCDDAAIRNYFKKLLGEHYV